MVTVWTPLRDCVGELLDGVRRVIDEGPPLRRGPADRSPARRPDPVSDGEPEAEPGADAAASPAAEVAPAVAIPAPATAADGVPPGPWRWRWVWATPGRPAGMALVAGDGRLVLWSPGGFADPAAPPDGRPTPEVAAALASLPELSDAAAAGTQAKGELERARATAQEAQRLLHRALGAVDDEIGRHEAPASSADLPRRAG